MRALVTGAGGFVGRHLTAALRSAGAEIFACCGPGEAGEGYFSLDITDAEALRYVVQTFEPNVVFHLAAQSFVPDALATPIETYEINAIGTARLADAVRACNGAARIVFASSAEAYGPRRPDEYPLREVLDLRPATPYGASKAAAEAMLVAAHRSYRTDVVIARVFNTIGPGQDERFVVASFAAQLRRIAQGGPRELFVGNLETARDFLDVRDVVRAYITLAQHGESGEIYNVCSGAAVTIRDVLRELIGIARVAVEVREDPSRVRSTDAPLSVGSSEKLQARTEWKPQIPLIQSLREIYETEPRDVASVHL